jgi:hypothetical protein
MSLFGKALDITKRAADTAKSTAGPLAGKARDLTVQGVHIASAGANKVTGGSLEDAIDSVTEKVEGVLGRKRGK